MLKNILSVATGLLAVPWCLVSACANGAPDENIDNLGDGASTSDSTTTFGGIDASTMSSSSAVTTTSTTGGSTTVTVSSTTDTASTTGTSTTGDTSTMGTSTTDSVTTGSATATTGTVEPEPEVNISGGPGQCPESWGGSNDGSLTWYTFSQGTASIGDVNCSFGIQQNPDRVNHVVTGDGQYFGAMNTADYNMAAACGACVEVSRQDTGQKVVITIVDQCPVATNNKCVSGHIDLSQAAFSQIGNVGDGYVGARAGKGQVSWKYVPCPTDADVSFKLKEPDNEFWNEVLVQGHRAPIASVEVRVDGTWVPATRMEYNYWAPPENDFGTPPFRVRATDVHGNFVEATLEMQPGDIDTGLQLCQ